MRWWDDLLCGLVKTSASKQRSKSRDGRPRSGSKVGAVSSWYREVLDSPNGTVHRSLIGVPKVKGPKPGSESVRSLLEACSEAHEDGELRVVQLSMLRTCYDDSHHPIAVLLVQPDESQDRATPESQAIDDRESAWSQATKAGLLECWYANLAAVEFNSFGSIAEFMSRIQMQMMQQPALILMFESLIRRLQEGRAVSVRQFLPSMAPQEKSSRSKSCAAVQGGHLDVKNVFNSIISNGSQPDMGTDNSFMMLEVAVCLAEKEDGDHAPALFLHYAPAFQQSRTALAAQLKRDNIALGHMPSLVTIFTLDGRVLHQNGKSMAYMGFMQGHPTPSCHITDTQHTLRKLFKLEPTMLDDMWRSLKDGNAWQGRVRMPMVVNLESGPKRPVLSGLYCARDGQSAGTLPKLRLPATRSNKGQQQASNPNEVPDDLDSLENLLASGAQTADAESIAVADINMAFQGTPDVLRPRRLGKSLEQFSHAALFGADDGPAQRARPVKARRHSVTFGHIVTEHFTDNFSQPKAEATMVLHERLRALSQQFQTTGDSGAAHGQKEILMVGVAPVEDTLQHEDISRQSRLSTALSARPPATTNSLRHARMRRFSHQDVYDADYNQTLKSAMWQDMPPFDRSANASHDSKASVETGSNNSMRQLRNQLLKTLRANASVDSSPFWNRAPSSSGVHALSNRSSSQNLKESESFTSDLLSRERRGSKSFTLSNHRKVDRRVSGAMKQADLPAANRVMKMLSHKSKEDTGQPLASKSSVPRSSSNVMISERASTVPTSRLDATQEEEAWFECEASLFDDPATGEAVILLVQTDVTAAVRAEIKMQRVLNAEHALLEEVFPKHVLEVMALDKVKDNEHSGGLATVPHVETLARSHKEVTILFADIVTFTNMCQLLEAKRVMSFLNQLFTQFDNLISRHGVYKVETIGDCYMVCGGAIHEDEEGCKTIDEDFVDPDHARKVFSFALDMLHIASTMPLPTDASKHVQLRIGIHSGPVVSGVVGNRMPRFCLFGDTVNTASRMESTSQPGRVHVSAAARDAIGTKPAGGIWQPTGGIPVKGKGIMETYLYQPNHQPPAVVVKPVQVQLEQPRHQAPHRVKSAYNMLSPSRLGRESCSNLASETDVRRPRSPRAQITSLSGGIDELQQMNSVEPDYVLMHNASSSSLGSYRNTWGQAPPQPKDDPLELPSPASCPQPQTAAVPVPVARHSEVADFASLLGHGLGSHETIPEDVDTSGSVTGLLTPGMPPHLQYNDMLLAMSSAPARSRISHWVASKASGTTATRADQTPSFEFCQQPSQEDGLESKSVGAVWTPGPQPEIPAGNGGGSDSNRAHTAQPDQADAGTGSSGTQSVSAQDVEAEGDREWTLPLALLSGVDEPAPSAFGLSS